MDDFFDRFLCGAASIDERLSAAFEAVRGHKNGADAAARRLAAWCRSAANGDWTLFAQRLMRDGLTLEEVLPRLGAVRFREEALFPAWARDARWIDDAFTTAATPEMLDRLHAAGEPIAFEQLIVSVVAAAEERLWPGLAHSAADNLSDTAIASLCHSLARDLSELCAPALFARYVPVAPQEGDRLPIPSRATDSLDAPSKLSRYERFVADMRNGGLRDLFEAKPILLKLVAIIVRQWIETTREFIERLDVDLPELRTWLGTESTDAIVVTEIRDSMSDRHNGGRSVKLIRLRNDSEILYKPKDLHLDAAWENVVNRLNAAEPPVSLRAVRVVSRDGYGWSEFIDHAECADFSDFPMFFRRAGAWLCLFHLFVGTDMHEQNMVATGDHPVPVDLEMLLQSLAPTEVESLPAVQAATLAGQRIVESITMTGLLPNYWRTPENALIGSGGLNNVRVSYTQVAWENINTDGMWPVLKEKKDDTPKNLPTIKGEEARLADHVDALVAGFEEYAAFLCQNKHTALGAGLFDGFDALRTRRLLKNTRFYYLLLERLKDHRTMGDGAEWSAQLDFVARLCDWDREEDPLWPTVRSERIALAELCVPHFVSPTSGHEIADALGHVATHTEEPGIDRARRRYAAFDAAEIRWQIEIIELSTRRLTQAQNDASVAADPSQCSIEARDHVSGPESILFAQVARDISQHLTQLALRRGDGASWVGLEWFGDSGLSRPASLGDDLYSGVSGIGLFLAAEARMFDDDEARHVSVASLSALRYNLHSANAPRFARALGIGAATGVGSIIYTLATTSVLLDDESLLRDARLAAALISDDLIAADHALDVFDGSAGCILSLLKLFDLTSDGAVLAQAVKCGEHLLRQPRIGTPGRQSWLGFTVAERAPTKLSRPLNGMSHGAAGFAYALAALGKVTNREDFSRAADECIAFENDTFSEERSNWPDFRLKGSETEPAWPCQWCHGAAGIGLARLGILRRRALEANLLTTDVQRAARCVEAAWPYSGDNLCCGNLGNIEFLTESGRTLEIPALVTEASTRLTALLAAASVNGEYFFDGLDRRFNLGLFRGIAGVGYTCLRQMSALLPSVLIWQ
jgi:type 2 lantibiotic biosynthesis protein LanM